MSENKLYCSLCNKAFPVDTSVTEISKHLKVKHRIGGIGGLIAACLITDPEVQVQSCLTHQSKGEHE